MPAMRALMYGVEPEAQPKPETDNRNVKILARTPTRLVEADEPAILVRVGW